MRPHIIGARAARTIYEILYTYRRATIIFLILGVAVGCFGIFTMRLDMSFRPTFTNDPDQIERTEGAEREFGRAGFNELVVMIDIGDARDAAKLRAVHELAEGVAKSPHVIAVREPLNFPFTDRSGVFHPAGVGAQLPHADPATIDRLVTDVAATPSARRLIFGDGNRRVAVTATFDIANQDFATWREADREFRNLVSRWASASGAQPPFDRTVDTQITGYPDVEQVYAHEVLFSTLRGVAVLIMVMIAILYVYFRRVVDVVICLIGVTLSVPLTLGAMNLLGQPFSIVNSQVLTLVLIVGIAEALQQHQEYIRRREAGRDHPVANREAFSLLAWAAFMTGLATVLGFAALVVADMSAISSYGLCTAVGVSIAYLVNWLVVPRAIDVFYRGSAQRQFGVRANKASLAMLRVADRMVTGRPGAVVATFVVVVAVLGWLGLSQISIDQKVNEELPAGHPALVAQRTFEQEFTGFLGPELWIRPTSGTIGDHREQLVQLVEQLCAQPEVRYVGSVLDLIPQPTAPGAADGPNCRREAADLTPAVAARAGAYGPGLHQLSRSVLDADATQAAVIIRVADIGTKASIPFSVRVQDIARQAMPSADIDLVGPWWLAQQGMHSLSFEMGLSAIAALALILPVMWVAIRDRRLFLAAIVPTVLPIMAVLGFMGLAGITVRIGTAMMLAIALGLAASNTIHLCLRIRDRVRAGVDAESAVSAVLLRTGTPVMFGSYVLIAGFVSMLGSSLLALQDMGAVGTFTMAFAMVADLLVGPAVYLLLVRIGKPGSANRPADTEPVQITPVLETAATGALR